MIKERLLPQPCHGLQLTPAVAAGAWQSSLGQADSGGLHAQTMDLCVPGSLQKARPGEVNWGESAS